MHQPEPPDAGGGRPGLRRRVAILAGIAVGVFVLAAIVTRGAWDLSVMATVLVAVALVIYFVARGGLAGADEEERSKAPPVVPPAPTPETSAAHDGSGGSSPASDLADRYYFKGAWFTVKVHAEDSAGHRLDLAGPLCPVCHEPMLRAHEREPLEQVGEHRVEVYKCHKSNLHPLVTVQLDAKERLVDQARSACLHQMADGQFDSLPAEGGEAPALEEPKPEESKAEDPPPPESPKPPA
jgi:hypothetical protein